MYFNTNKEQGQEFIESCIKNENQDDIILKFFQIYDDEHFSACDIMQRRILRCPLTSIRRSINTLTKKGLIEKTDYMIRGFYGKKVHTWKLTNNAKGEL